MSATPPPRPSAPEIESLLATARRAKFAVLGDVMLDVSVLGAVDRVCPEAPVPVLAVEREEFGLGGAANVAGNLAPWAGDAVVLGVVGEDDAAGRLETLLREGGARSALVREKGRPTTVKTRLLSDNNRQMLLRCDRESRADISPETAARLLEALKRELDGGVAAILAADYAKGCLPRSVFAEAARLCRERGVPLLTDPKVADLTRYAGSWLLKPNRRESEASAGFSIREMPDVRRAAELFLERTGAEAILITLGARGMALLEASGQFRHIPTEAREVFDVTGAGDTTLAFLGLGVAAGWDLAASAALANLAAGVTVSKIGAARVEPFELLAASRERESDSGSRKLVPRSETAALFAELRRRGLKTVFTNGCFDLFHPGHIDLLRRARALGDVLAVGVNSDASIRRIKGPTRPFLDERGRLAILCSLECVDHVIVYDEDTPRALLAEGRPDILAKGANYSEDEVVGAEIARAYGGEIRLLPVAAGHSVTDLSREIHRKLSQSREAAATS
jgi:D-beta-D-heptose 7-phosphate kinase/D-beta-D-heptose 1-phosphate adenosyltransferase